MALLDLELETTECLLVKRVSLFNILRMSFMSSFDDEEEISDHYSKNYYVDLKPFLCSVHSLMLAIMCCLLLLVDVCYQLVSLQLERLH